MNDAQEAFNQIIWETRNFIKEIIKETVEDPEKYSMRIEVSQGCVKVLIYNSDIGEMVGQPYDIKRFMELCKEKKLEFQLNHDIRKLVLKAQDKSNKLLRWM